MNLKQVARQMLSAEETRQEVFLDAIGLTTRTAEAALERFGVEAVADPGKFSRMTHNLFVSNMLNGLTGAQRRTAGIFGMEYFGKFVDDVLEGPNGKRYEAAKKELREYGIPDSEAKAFSDWFKANIRDGIPQGDEFTRFDNTKYGKMYKEGLFAFATRTSLQASLVDKPQLAGKAGANWIYQLLSFAYTFQRQVFWQVVNRAKSAPDARAKYNVIAGAALTHGLILGTTYLITEMIRYPLRGKPERKEDQEINGMLLKMMETFDRGTPLPYTSIALNLAASVKYMHSATERAAGPTGAYMGNILDGYLKFAFANKESTNTAERAAAKSLYMMLAVPTLMVLLSRTPAKTLPMQTAQMLSLMMVSGKRAQDKAADLLAGPKPEKPTGRRTRERRRSAR
jgi:hypothetical protein